MSERCRHAAPSWTTVSTAPRRSKKVLTQKELHLDGARADLLQRESGIAEQESALKARMAELDTLETEAKAAIDRAAELEAQIKPKESELAKERDAVASGKRQLEEALRDLEARESTLTTAEARIGEMRDQAEKKMAEIEEGRKSLAGREKELAELEQRRAEIERGQAELEERTKAIAESTAELEAREVGAPERRRAAGVDPPGGGDRAGDGRGPRRPSRRARTAPESGGRMSREGNWVVWSPHGGSRGAGPSAASRVSPSMPGRMYAATTTEGGASCAICRASSRWSPRA